MFKLTLLCFCSLLSLSCYGQITASRAKALNNYAEYANQSAVEVTQLFNQIVRYYPRIKYAQRSKSANLPTFDCQRSPNEFFFTQAINGSTALSNAAVLNEKLSALHEAAAFLDKKCKEIDTYHKLKDYEFDNFKKAEALIAEIQTGLVTYRKQQTSLAAMLELAYANAPVTTDLTTDKKMRKEIAREKAFLDLWSYNLNDDAPSGWPVEALQKSISETDQSISMFTRTKPVLTYPASSMYGSFQEALSSILESKRSALDGYNYEAKQSDKHSNGVYLDLINALNGMLVADQITFIGFAHADQYFGLATIQYVPLFEIRTAAQHEAQEVKPFQDIPHAAVKIVPQSNVISGPAFQALGNYIELINESVRQMDYLQRVLRNYNSSATYYKDLTSYKGKGGLTYGHKDFQIPLSLYQAAISRSGDLLPAYRQSLNDQAKVLLSILTEMDQLSIALEADSEQKLYEKDNLAKAYAMLERYAVIFDIADQKKEQLYLDLRSIASSYLPASPAGSWAVSNKALLQLVDEDRIQLAKARAFCKGDSASIPSTAMMDRLLREIIANEYANMKGIPQLGSSNGNCPYTPYEHVPQNSRTFSEKLANIKKRRTGDVYNGPYYEYYYIYNVIVDDYNKFCELAKVSILKDVKQPMLFKVEYPKKRIPELAVAFPNPGVQSDKTEDTLVALNDVLRQRSGSHHVNQTNQPNLSTVRLRHDTIKVTDIIRIETQRKDTIYIEKHDTIYLGDSHGNLLTMEGYSTNNLVFLLDVSGSMSAGQKLPLLKKSILLLLKMLRKEDNVSIVVYSGKARTVLLPTSATEQEKIKKVIENLRSDGATDGNAGLRMAYKVADGNYIRGGNNRIVLATDGEFPVSAESELLISKFSMQDIFLSVFNFGRSASSAESLGKLARLGKGNYENITRDNSDISLVREAKAKLKK